MSDMVKDILLKAAEDVQSGMWCREDYFAEVNILPDELITFRNHLSATLESRRCALGSLAVATTLLGGTILDYRAAEDLANRAVRALGAASGVIDYNDNELSDDPFEAGQTLAELFRSTAESL